MRQSRHDDDRSDAAPTLLDAALLRGWPMPLDADGDKLTRGTVLVIAGSPTTAGAALLAGTAALRMGAGRLQIATPEPISIGVSIAMPEALVVPLGVDSDGDLSGDDACTALAEPMAEAQAILIGPGLMGLAAIGKLLVQAAAVVSSDAIVVVDAAALGAIAATGSDSVATLSKRLILTPNRQELDDLVAAVDRQDTDDAATQAARLSSALGAVVTCFSDLTAFDGRRWQTEPATPGLGTSGSGDVLAGLAAGAAARCGDPAQAACWATFVHADAGNRLSARLGTTSFIARELLDEVPHVLAQLE